MSRSRTLTLEQKQAKMKERAAAKKVAYEEPEDLTQPLCTLCNRRRARKGQVQCSRCTFKGVQEKLRDTLPGLPVPPKQEPVRVATPALSPTSVIEQQFSRKQAAKLIGVSQPTLIRWEQRGIVSPRHLVNLNKYIYTQTDVDKAIAYKNEVQPIARNASTQEETEQSSTPGTLDDFARKRKNKIGGARKLEKTVARSLNTLGQRGLL